MTLWHCLGSSFCLSTCYLKQISLDNFVFNFGTCSTHKRSRDAVPLTALMPCRVRPSCSWTPLRRSGKWNAKTTRISESWRGNTDTSSQGKMEKMYYFYNDDTQKVRFACRRNVLVGTVFLWDCVVHFLFLVYRLRWPEVVFCVIV